MLYRENPVAVWRAFTETDLRQVDLYQALASTLPPDELAKELDPHVTPQTRAIREAAEKVGREFAAKVPDAVIFKAFDTNGEMQIYNPLSYGNIGGVPGGPADTLAMTALRQDFENDYAVAYSRVQNPDQAQALALKWLAGKWGATFVGPGGAMLIAYPPERYYPVINDDDHAWMDEQAAAFVEEMWPDAQSWSISAGPQTEADISARQPPAYVMTVIDKNGVFRSEVVRFDYLKALAESRAQFEQRRQRLTSPDQQTGMGSDQGRMQTIGPPQ